ncbi:AAA family ATPase [Nocardia sp. NPDC058705]|uniref:AAA family ATPase n=1 Tax=Nocardia sp. NPDC058705 TaxID=3346609 RepID=UPI00369E26B7
MTTLPAPTAHCRDHDRFDPVCFSCKAFAAEQISEIRQARAVPDGGMVPGTEDRDAARGPRSPFPRGGDQDHDTTNRRNQRKRTKSGASPLEAVPDHSEPVDSRGPGPVPDHGDQAHIVDFGRYYDVAAMLAGGLPEPPKPDYGTRTDGRALFYAGEVNTLFGDPESGKTWVALSAAREILGEYGAGRVLVIDMDHNGPVATVSRLVALGAAVEALGNRERFLYVEPDSRLHLAAIVADMSEWSPNIVVVDSLGELMPLFGSSSNSADEYTHVNSAVLKPLSKTGAAVLVIDHLAKGDASRKLGQSGTTAKRRAIGGVALRVTVQDAFAPGSGGSACLTVNKDRHGGVRQHCPPGREPVAGRFELKPTSTEGLLESFIHAPDTTDRPPSFTISGEPSDSLADDVAELDKLDPPPQSKRDVQDRMSWGGTRASRALGAWRRERDDEGDA